MYKKSYNFQSAQSVYVIACLASDPVHVKLRDQRKRVGWTGPNIWADLVEIFWELLISYSDTLKKSKQWICNIVLPNVTITCSETAIYLQFI